MLRFLRDMSTHAKISSRKRYMAREKNSKPPLKYPLEATE